MSNPSGQTNEHGASQSARWSLSSSSSESVRASFMSGLSVSICIPSVGRVEHDGMIWSVAQFFTAQTMHDDLCCAPFE